MQPLIIPIAFILCSFAGIVVTSAGIQLYGEVLWDPMLLIDKWDDRAAAFFASLSFFLATIGSNISANTFGAGNDMTALFPKVSFTAQFVPSGKGADWVDDQYINIRRGQIICAIIGGWAFVPWEILAK